MPRRTCRPEALVTGLRKKVGIKSQISHENLRTRCLEHLQSLYHIPCCLCSTRGPYGLLHRSRSSTLCSWPDKPTDWTTCLRHGSGRENLCHPRYSENCFRIIQKPEKIDDFFQRLPEIMRQAKTFNYGDLASSHRDSCSFFCRR